MSQVNPLSNNDPTTLDGLEKVFTEDHCDTTDDVGFHTGSRNEVVSSDLFSKGLEKIYSTDDTKSESTDSKTAGKASDVATRPRSRKRGSGEYMNRSSKVLDEIELIRLEIKPACIPWPVEEKLEADSSDKTDFTQNEVTPSVTKDDEVSDNEPIQQDFSPPPAPSIEDSSAIASAPSTTPIEPVSEVAPPLVESPENTEMVHGYATDAPAAEAVGDKPEKKQPRQPTSSFLKDLIEKSSKHLRQATGRGTAITTVEASFIDEFDMVSRNDLIGILHSFIGMLQRGGNPSEQLQVSTTDGQLMPATTEVELTALVEDKTEELEEMRRLVIEAQETIIKLLTDRVEDRAKIATLETELKFLPDLQAQADRAMAVAFRAEEFRSDIHKIKYELEHYRIANIRAQENDKWKGWMTFVRKWFLKGQGKKHSDFRDHS